MLGLTSLASPLDMGWIKFRFHNTCDCLVMKSDHTGTGTMLRAVRSSFNIGGLLAGRVGRVDTCDVRSKKTWTPGGGSRSFSTLVRVELI